MAEQLVLVADELEPRDELIVIPCDDVQLRRLARDVAVVIDVVERREASLLKLANVLDSAIDQSRLDGQLGDIEARQNGDDATRPQ